MSQTEEMFTINGVKSPLLYSPLLGTDDVVLPTTMNIFNNLYELKVAH